MISALSGVDRTVGVMQASIMVIFDSTCNSMNMYSSLPGFSLEVFSQRGNVTSSSRPSENMQYLVAAIGCCGRPVSSPTPMWNCGLIFASYIFKDELPLA